MSEDILPELVDRVSWLEELDKRPPVSGFPCDENSKGSAWPSEYGGGRPSYDPANETGEPGLETARLLTGCIL